MVDLAQFHNNGDHLDLQWSDGRLDRVFAVWLRDNSPSPQARHPNGQKLFDITDLAPRVALADVQNVNGALHIRFAPDGHEANFGLEWLRERAAPVDLHAHRRLWGAELARAMPAHGYETVCTDSAAKCRWLADLRDLGFTLVTGVPTEPGTLIEVAEQFGFVRETNYGRFFEVRSDPKPINLANTGLGLSCHTDNPYRDPVPGLQLLHCLVSENDGGNSVVVDGYKAASLLLDQYPADFALLTRHDVRSAPSIFPPRSCRTSIAPIGVSRRSCSVPNWK